MLPERIIYERRALTYFRGEPDPFKGDVPNQKVRDMAKEALDAVFAAVDLNAVPSSAPLQVIEPLQIYNSHG